MGVPDELKWQGVKFTETCSGCSKRLTKFLDGSPDVKFVCLNKNCSQAGWGFCQLSTGIYVHGYYRAALDHLEQHLR